MALTIVHHNHKGFIRLSDHLTPFIQAEFKGSRATENFSCRRTKTATIVNCLGDYYQIELIGDLKSSPFSIILNGSNDTGIEKIFSVTVRVSDVNFNRVMSKFLDMNIKEGKDVSTAAAMFKSVDNLFTKIDLKWDSVTAIGVGITNSNIRQRNSIASGAKKKNKDIVIQDARVIYCIMLLVKLQLLLHQLWF